MAIKKVGDVFSDLVDAKRIMREIKLLRHFDGHENIIAIADIMTIPPDTTDFKDVYIVTNLMESDMDRIIASGQPLTDQHFQYFIYQARLPCCSWLNDTILSTYSQPSAFMLV